MTQFTDPPAVGEDARVDQLLALEARTVEGGTVVTATGEVDMLTMPRLRAMLREQLDRERSLLLADLRGLEFLGSSGLAVLVETLDAARERGVDLALVCDSREVLRPLEATGLTELFEIHSDVDSALAARS